ncbi:hypothetical protein V2A60_006878 [Cordyceps javanica]
MTKAGKAVNDAVNNKNVTLYQELQGSANVPSPTNLAVIPQIARGIVAEINSLNTFVDMPPLYLAYAVDGILNYHDRLDPSSTSFVATHRSRPTGFQSQIPSAGTPVVVILQALQGAVPSR